jgi:hypothetical protein
MAGNASSRALLAMAAARTARLQALPAFRAKYKGTWYG